MSERDPKTGRFLPAPKLPIPWHQRWRNGIRLGESGVFATPWGTALATTDMVIAGILFLVAASAGGIVIAADPVRPLVKIWPGSVLLAVTAGGFGVVFWRHTQNENARPVAELPLSPITPSTTGLGPYNPSLNPPVNLLLDLFMTDNNHFTGAIGGVDNGTVAWNGEQIAELFFE